jgi:hypothetical protein
VAECDGSHKAVDNDNDGRWCEEKICADYEYNALTDSCSDLCFANSF